MSEGLRRLWKALARQTLRAVRRRYQRWWPSFSRSAGRQTTIRSGTLVRIDSVHQTGHPATLHADDLWATTLARLVAGRAVVVTLIVEGYGGNERPYLVSVLPSTEELSRIRPRTP
jgi:hypothetical protein